MKVIIGVIALFLISLLFGDLVSHEALKPITKQTAHSHVAMNEGK
jgi:hypothetical protein